MTALQKGNVYALPVLHYNLEVAQEVYHTIQTLKPACIAVELAETMSLQLMHAASRLPDITVVSTETKLHEKLYYLVEPCDGCFEALRSALEKQIPAYCIDLDMDAYPQWRDPIPDPYAIYKLGLDKYFELFPTVPPTPLDKQREMYMARRLKELSCRYENVLFIGGVHHIKRILELLDRTSFPRFDIPTRDLIELTTPDEDSLRHIMGEFGWISAHYEAARHPESDFLDRQRLIYNLYKEGGKNYEEREKGKFEGYHIRNLMKFGRNYALIHAQLLPDLFKIIQAAKGCVDHNYAYEVWELATDYPHYHNVDGLPEESLSPEEIWGHSKLIRFHLKAPSPKAFSEFTRRKDKSKIKMYPPGPFSICSYQPEDIKIENFGNFLRKKGVQLLSDEGARTIPFTTSIEDGIDTRETIRHYAEKKLYVKTKGKPPGGVGSLVVIFDEDAPQEGEIYEEKYPWLTTWLGEHNQESDMAFYATSMTAQIVGPGISKCEYGGFMMSFPPRRLMDVWGDPDYLNLRSKAEVLLAAAIDYAQKPLIVYVGSKPPRTQLKSYAKRFGKKVLYIPIGQLSPQTLHKLRLFHVLDGHDKRAIADEFIF